MKFTKQGSRLRRIIVNADDYGLSSDVNEAILSAFSKGLISSATIMTNMPGFDEACELAHRMQIQGAIGLHLNLTAGRPLTEGIARSPRFCDAGGRWLPRRRIFWVTRQDRALLEAEITAQVEACIRRGIAPTHIDSHHHIHEEPGILPVVIKMAKQLRIPSVRLACNTRTLRSASCSIGRRLLSICFRNVLNSILRLNRLAGTDFFGGAPDVARALRNPVGDVEVMVHPRYDHFRRLVDLDGENLEARMTSLPIQAGELCSYAAK